MSWSVRTNGMFSDTAAFEASVANDDPLVYEFHDLSRPEESGEITFGTSITCPGKVGDEYSMTKGRFHRVLETVEVYYCLRGSGYRLMQDPEGRWEAQEFHPAAAVYIPPRFAHRSVNVCGEPLVTFFAFRADASRDYGTIETRGSASSSSNAAAARRWVDNPRWKR